MSKSAERRSKKAGLPPGSLVHVGKRRVEKAKITVIDYDEGHLEEKEAQKVEECFPYKDTPTVTWINISGLHDVEIIEKLGAQFGLHPLILEDILNTGQRPKMEDFGDYIYLVVRMFSPSETNQEKMEQVSLILGPDFVISLLESESQIFEPVKERIRKGKGRIRKMASDYLAYALVDAIVDSYFFILERLGERIELLEDELLSSPQAATMRQIHQFKGVMIYLRKSVWPLREVINNLQRGESKLIKSSTQIYLRDIYDHTIQVIDTIETYRDMLSGMLDTYISSLSNRMNEVMKILTIIATIFIPLTFIAGIYGMNFKFMPELEWRWGYFMIWGIMAVVALIMVVYFKRKRWL
ncbi:MAG: magnesium/cobalt transporter CorA [Candidatus Aminicenantales bacterium]